MTDSRHQGGSIEIICGSMFSGKTEELMRRLKRAQIARQRVQVFKPLVDSRYSDKHVQSHDGIRVPSVSVTSPVEILHRIDDNTRVVGIDEVQFFSNDVVEVVQKLAYRGLRMIVAGLDLDYRGEPFGPMPTLLAIAEYVTKLTAVCVVCGGPASRTQRLTPNQQETVLVGAHESYEARCRFCHEPRLHQKNQEQLGFFSAGESP